MSKRKTVLNLGDLDSPERWAPENVPVEFSEFTQEQRLERIRYLESELAYLRREYVAQEAIDFIAQDILEEAQGS